MSIASFQGPFIGWVVAKGAQVFIEESFPPLRKSEKTTLQNRRIYAPQGEDLPSRYQGILWRWRQWVRYEYETRIHWQIRAVLYGFVGINIPWIVCALVLLNGDVENNFILKTSMVMLVCATACHNRLCLTAIRAHIMVYELPQPFKDIVLRIVRMGEQPLVNLEEEDEVRGQYQQGILLYNEDKFLKVPQIE